MNPRLNAESVIVTEESANGISTDSFADLLVISAVHADFVVVYVKNRDAANVIAVQVLGHQQDNAGNDIQSNEPFTLSTTGAPSANSAASQTIAAGVVAKLVIANPGPDIAVQIKSNSAGNAAACSAYAVAR